MKQYVITRFSLIYDMRKKPYINREKWFVFRTKLFFESNYQSIIYNSVLPRKIIVLFDIKDKNLYKKYFSVNDIKNLIHPIFTTLDNVRENVENYIFSDLNVSEPYILSRIDSDDIVCSNFFNVILREVSVTKRNFYVVSEGYRTDFENIVKLRFKNSPFISIYYNSKLLPFIFDFNHTSVYKYNPHLIDDTCFIQIIHGTNIANHLPNRNSLITRIRYFAKVVLYPNANKYFISSKKIREIAPLEIPNKIELNRIRLIIDKYKSS